jgi:hypothetical protein
LRPTCTETSVRNAASPRSISSQAGAAVFLRNDDPEQPELGHAVDHRQVEAMLDVVVDRAW